MGKVILIILLVVVAVFWLRHKALAQRGKRSSGAADGATPGGAPAHGDANAGDPNAQPHSTAGAARTLQGEKMIACVRCNVNVPQREAVQGASGGLYCGIEHRALARDEAR